MQFKAIIEVSMISTPDRFTDNSLMPYGPFVTGINNSAIKSLHIFTEVLYFKEKTDVFQLGASK